jgi:hypothetical protein
VKKFPFVVAFAAFVGSAITGAACTSDLQQACEDFVSARNTCESFNNDPPPKYGFDLCARIDPDCQEFYECALTVPCEEASDDKFRLNYKKGVVDGVETECVQPENKECTDADLRE